MLKNGDDFKSLYNYKYDSNSEKKFNKTLNFKNIFDFHLDLVQEIILKNKRNMKDFNFYLVDLIDMKEVNELVQKILINYEKNNENEIIVPDVKYYIFYGFYKFNNFFDFNFTYNINLNK
jgi:hypothetical protein